MQRSGGDTSLLHQVAAKVKLRRSYRDQQGSMKTPGLPCSLRQLRGISVDQLRKSDRAGSWTGNRKGMAYAASGNASNAPCFEQESETGNTMAAPSQHRDGRLLRIQTRCCGQSLICLIDCGASRCYLDSQVVLRLGLQPVAENATLELGDGTRVPSKGCIEEIDFYDGISYILPEFYSDRSYDRGRYGIRHVMARTGEPTDQLGFPHDVCSRPRNLLPHHRCSSGQGHQDRHSKARGGPE